MRPSSVPQEKAGRNAVKLVATPFTHDEVAAIDDVRFSNRHPTRTQTVRYLVQKGLEAVAAEAGPPRAGIAQDGTR